MGNKLDLSEKRVVSEARGRALADEYGFRFFETSAKDNVCVEEVRRRGRGGGHKNQPQTQNQAWGWGDRGGGSLGVGIARVWGRARRGIVKSKRNTG